MGRKQSTDEQNAFVLRQAGSFVSSTRVDASDPTRNYRPEAMSRVRTMSRP